MADASLHGRAALKTKSINVEANLLAQRTAERGRLRTTGQKRTAAILVAVLTAGIALPPLWRAHSRAGSMLAGLQQRDRRLTQGLNDIQKQQEPVKQVQADNEALVRVKETTKACLGHLMLFFNGATADVSFDNVKATVSSGQIEIGAKGQAQGYAAIGDFVTKTSKNQSVINTVLSSAHNSTAPGSHEVEFELTTKVDLGRTMGVSP